jgi:hypothetical protein
MTPSSNRFTFTFDGICVSHPRRHGISRPPGAVKPTVAKEINMAKDTHVTAATRFVEANGIRYAYRRFGSESGTPLVFLQHFRGGLDNWDPSYDG